MESDQFAGLDGAMDDKSAKQFAAQYDDVVQRASQPNIAPKFRRGLAQELMSFGLVDRAREMMKPIDEEEGEPSDITLFLDRVDAGEAILAEAGVQEPTVEPELGRHITGILLAPDAGGSRRALIVFAGNGDRAFPLPPMIRSMKETHLIVVKDPNRCFSLCEIPRLGKDLPTNLQRLKAVLAKLGADQLYTMGFSSGGFGAMKFGLEMGANGVLAFSTPTSLDIGDEPGSDLSRYPQLTALYKRARHLGTSMGKEYRARKPHPSVILVYGALHRRDAYFARHMSGIPGVELSPLAGYGQHASFGEAVSRRVVGSLMQRLMSLKAWGAPATAQPAAAME